jgi:amino acid adenylation domain-containing protein
LSHIEDSYPLSPMQQGMLYHTLAYPNQGIDIGQMVIALAESLNTAAFEAAWHWLTARHAALRTAFCWTGPDDPCQQVYRTVNLPLTTANWRDLSAPDQTAHLEQFLLTDRRRGFDLRQPPLHRLTLFRLGLADYRCVWTFHHILLDGYSLSILLRELFARYEALCNQQEFQPDLPPPYRTHINWLQQQEWSRAEPFWRCVLQDVTAPTPITVASPPQPALPAACAEHETSLPETTTAQLQALAQANRLTLNTLVQAAWAILLSRYSGETDVIFGATRACRYGAVPNAESMVGLLINTLPVRVTVSPHAMLIPWLRDLRMRHLAVSKYQHTPLLTLQTWSNMSPGATLFDSVVVFNHARLGTRLRAQDRAWLHRPIRLISHTNYPLTLSAYGGAALSFCLSYDTRRFAPPTIRRLLRHLTTLLAEMAANPNRRLTDLPMLTGPERRQILVDWNQPDIPAAPDSGQTLPQLFEVQVQKQPQRVAVNLPGQAGLTYGELNRQVNRLAHYLRALGVTPNTLVALCLERSPAMVTAILAVLKAGGAYVPLEPALPPARLAFMLQDARCPVLVTQSRLLPTLPHFPGRVVCLDGADAAVIAAQPAANPTGGALAHHLAYAIYTSGSTGQPKAALITHHNVTSLFAATRLWFQFNENDVWTLFHSYAFDFSVWELFGALLHGGRLVLVPRPEQLAAVLYSEGTTVLNQTPSAFCQLVQAETAGRPKPPALRLIIFGGEALSPANMKPWLDRHGDEHPRLVNMYGITETTVHVTYRPITQADLQQPGRSPIGRPIPGWEVFVLNPQGQPAPVGVPGELYVGGAGVAGGYLNRPDLTARRFIPHPFDDTPGGRLYKSGDAARWLPTGELEYLGRLDHQVKIRGYRIELGEIETVLARHPAVGQAVVALNDADNGSGRLTAYVTPAASALPAETELRRFLADHLPDYMLPARFVRLDRLPLTPNGKVDRRALPPPPAQTETAPAAAGDWRERRLLEIWAEILGVNGFGPAANFFDLGGHSLGAIRLCSRINAEFGGSLPLSAVLQNPTVAQQAAVLGLGAPSGEAAVVRLKTGNGKIPIFCLPGNLGNVFTDLGELAGSLTPDRPVYGLQDGPDNPTEVAALARCYVAQLQAVQPRSPYLLAGICAGGLVAYEMARQLDAAGHKVALLALIEPSPPAVFGWRACAQLAGFVLERLVKRSGHHLHRLVSQPSPDQKSYARLKAKVIGNTWAAARYRPHPYAGRISLFLTEDSLRRAAGKFAARWRRLAGGGLDLFIIPGNHNALTRANGAVPDPGHIRALAEQLERCMEELG